MKPRILLLDIEIAPNLAAVWGIFNQNIGLDMLLNDSYILSWAAGWLGDEDIYYNSLGISSKKVMLREIYSLLEEADVVVTYNGDRFDLKILNQEFMLQGWGPPSPYKSLDLLKTVRKRFRGTSNKLAYWLKRCNLGEKIKHRGPQLWIDCMNKNKEAFREMEEYNIHDVVELEKFYDFILPWIPNHPNMAMLMGEQVCPACGERHYQKRGYTITGSGKYNRYQCMKCGHWFRGNKSVLPKAAEERFIGV